MCRNPAPRPSRVISWAAFLTAVTLITGCGRGSSSTAAAPALAGVVVDEQGHPIAGVGVSLHGLALSTQTGAKGEFSITPPGGAEIYALSFSASGYAEQYRSLPWKNQSVDFETIALRAVDLSVTVTLPAQAGAVTEVPVTKGDAGASLGLPYQALVDAQGQPAHGDVQVDLTYWHPRGSQASMPGTLAAIGDGNAISELYTFGMLSVDVSQNGQQLQVAGGRTVSLNFQVPESMRAQMLSPGMPEIYWMDPSVGLWRKEVTYDSSQFAFDEAKLTVAVNVPHLSTWNIDSDNRISYGNCMTGQLINACTGGPAANTLASLYGLTSEQVIKWNLRTDGAGTYCLNVGSSRYINFQNDGTSYLRYVLRTSAQYGPEQDLVCNPLPEACRTCIPGYRQWGVPACNKCVLKFDDGSYYDYYHDGMPVTAYADTCPVSSRPVAAMKLCTFCSQTLTSASAPQCTYPGYPSTRVFGKCAVLQTVSVKPIGCSCSPLGGACGGGVGCCKDVSASASCSSGGVCVSCNRSPGDPCDDTTGSCCPYNGIDFTCSDGTCVPSLEL